LGFTIVVSARQFTRYDVSVRILPAGADFAGRCGSSLREAAARVQVNRITAVSAMLSSRSTSRFSDAVGQGFSPAGKWQG
jgi:hypothetical protein